MAEAEVGIQLFGGHVQSAVEEELHVVLVIPDTEVAEFDTQGILDIVFFCREQILEPTLGHGGKGVAVMHGASLSVGSPEASTGLQPGKGLKIDGFIDGIRLKVSCHGRTALNSAHQMVGANTKTEIGACTGMIGNGLEIGRMQVNGRNVEKQTGFLGLDVAEGDQRQE